ncbi:MAG TPA: sigma-70 family RNA polymerase sigma factor [Polyangiales bacterium]
MQANAVIERLVSSHREFLAYLQGKLGDRALAEDILNEAFVRGLEHSDAVPEEAATRWFYRVLRNAVIDHARRRAASSRKLAAFAQELEATGGGDETSVQVCQCVAQLAETLKPEYAEAVKRIEIDGLSVKDFAQEAGISNSNAGVRIFRAREALRQQVAKACGTCAEHGCVDCSCSHTAPTAEELAGGTKSCCDT